MSRTPTERNNPYSACCTFIPTSILRFSVVPRFRTFLARVSIAVDCSKSTASRLYIANFALLKTAQNSQTKAICAVFSDNLFL